MFVSYFFVIDEMNRPEGSHGTTREHKNIRRPQSQAISRLHQTIAQPVTQVRYVANKNVSQICNYANVAKIAEQLTSGPNTLMFDSQSNLIFRYLNTPLNRCIQINIRNNGISGVDRISFQNGSVIAGISDEAIGDSTIALSTAYASNVDDQIQEVKDQLDQYEDSNDSRIQSLETKFSDYKTSNDTRVTTLETSVNTDITPRLATVEEDISNINEAISGDDTGIVARVDALESDLVNNYTTTEDLPDAIVEIGDQLYVPLTENVTINFDDIGEEEEQPKEESMNVLTSVTGFIKSLTEAFHTMDDTITTITEAIAYIPTWLKKIITGFEDIATLASKIGNASMTLAEAGEAITSAAESIQTLTEQMKTAMDYIAALESIRTGASVTDTIWVGYSEAKMIKEIKRGI
jgi:hypothetical protein